MMKIPSLQTVCHAVIQLFPRDYTTNLSGSFSPQDVPFVLAFGPDTCGHVHVMMNRYKLGKSVTAPEDNLAHRYSLLLFSSGSYRVHIDGRCVANGLVSTDFVLMDKLVKDPIARKPSNWIDDEFITDSSASTSPEFIDDAKSMYYDSRFMSSPKTKNPDHKVSEIMGFVVECLLNGCMHVGADKDCQPGISRPLGASDYCESLLSR